MKEFNLNNNKIYIHAITPSHAASRHDFWVQLSLAQQGILNTVEEIDFNRSESEAKISDFLYYKRGLWLLAIDEEGHVIGEIDILIKNLARLRHVGVLTIGVLESHQRIGLGSLLMREALRWAHANKLKRIELSVLASNEPAILLYRKFNFIIEGIRKYYLYHQETNLFTDDLLMAKYLI